MLLMDWGEPVREMRHLPRLGRATQINVALVRPGLGRARWRDVALDRDLKAGTVRAWPKLGKGGIGQAMGEPAKNYLDFPTNQLSPSLTTILERSSSAERAST